MFKKRTRPAGGPLASRSAAVTASLAEDERTDDAGGEAPSISQSFKRVRATQDARQPPRGLAFSSLASEQQAAGAEEGSGDEGQEGPQTRDQMLKRQFEEQRQSGTASKHLEDWVNARLGELIPKSDAAASGVVQPPPQPVDQELYELPESLHVASSLPEAAARHPNWNQGLVEVQLPMDQRLKVVEEIESIRQQRKK